jgi:hypothetical protein
LAPQDVHEYRAEVDQAAREIDHARRLGVWQEELDALTAERDFIAGLRALRPGEQDRGFFGLRKDELVYAVVEAELLEIRRRDGRDMLVPTFVGWVAITTRGLVYAGGKRMRFDFSQLLDWQWQGHDTLVMQSSARQRPAAVTFVDDSYPVATALSVAHSDQRGMRSTMVQRREWKIAEHLRQKP